MKIIDISEHNGIIDFEKVKNEVDGVIIRCGYGSNIIGQDDKKWLRNVSECERLGIPFGIYLYSYAKGTAQALSEADHVLRLIKGHNPKFPIYYDLEQNGTGNFAVANAQVFCEKIKSAGYKVSIYANEYWWTTFLSGLRNQYPDKWVAKYSKNKPSNVGNYDLWQYSSSGTVTGILGRVDVNIGYETEQPQAPLKGNELLVAVVQTLQGLYGNGEDRKKKLGNNYETVQNFINHIYSVNIETLKDEVLAGKYGNGEVRKFVLGSRYDEVQALINIKNYTVKSGDTLNEIAAKYNTTISDILKKNPNITNPNKINIGQIIKI